MGDSMRKVQPINVAVTREQRETFEAEARHRGVGVSTTIRGLALERAGELRAERQRERARRWQTKRMRALADRIEAGDFAEASQAEIDAVFDRADAEYARDKRKGSTANGSVQTSASDAQPSLAG